MLLYTCAFINLHADSASCKSSCREPSAFIYRGEVKPSYSLPLTYAQKNVTVKINTGNHRIKQPQVSYKERTKDYNYMI